MISIFEIVAIAELTHISLKNLLFSKVSMNIFLKQR